MHGWLGRGAGLTGAGVGRAAQWTVIGRPASSKPGQSVPESPGPSCSFLAQGQVPVSQEETPWV